MEFLEKSKEKGNDLSPDEICNRVLRTRSGYIKSLGYCDAPKPGGPLTTRQPAEYKWMSGYPTPLQKIGQSLLCTGSSTHLQNLHILSQTIQYMQYISNISNHMSNTTTWAHKQYSICIPTMIQLYIL